MVDTGRMQRALDALNAKIKGAGDCPACGPPGVAKVQVAEHLVTPVTLSDEGGMTLGGSAYPLMMTICGNCGFTRFFNELILSPPSGGDDAAK